MDETREESDALRALDPHLPLLAATAAVEIDNLLLSSAGAREHPPRLEALNKITQMIEEIGASGAGQGALRQLCDPVSEAVVSKAFEESFRKTTESFKELNEAAKKLSLTVNGPDIRSEQGFLTNFRDFLLALSSYAASRRQSTLGDRPKPSYRR